MQPGDAVEVIDQTNEYWGWTGRVLLVDRHGQLWVRFNDGTPGGVPFTQLQLRLTQSAE